MEEREAQQFSKLLIVGPAESCSKAVEILLDGFKQARQAEWSSTLSDLKKLGKSSEFHIQAPVHLTISNKYFEADIDLTLAHTADLNKLDGFDGVVYILPDGKDPNKNYRQYLDRGCVQDMFFRLTIIDTTKKDFDLEFFTEDLPVYTETICVDMKGYVLGEERGEDLDRLVEGIGETVWRNHKRLETKRGPNEKLQQYLDSCQDDGQEGAPESREETSGPSMGEKVAEANTGQVSLEENPFPTPPPMEKLEGDLEDDMRIFEEIMAFKASSTGLAHEQKKIIADQLFSKLMKQYGDDL